MAEGESGAARAATALGLGAALIALGVAALRFAPGDSPPPPLSSAAADLAARRSEVVFDGAEAVFAARFRAELGRDYAPLRLRAFTRQTATPCAGAKVASGPFYCAETEDAAMDLAVVAALEPRLRKEAGAGIVLTAARLSAAHAAVALGPGSDADCLAGVFVATAAEQLGPIRPALYGRTLEAAESALAAVAPRAEWRDPAFFARDRPAREAAFARGVSAGRLSGCAGGPRLAEY